MIFSAWTRFIRQFDTHEIYRLIIGIGMGIILFLTLFLYRYYSVSGQLEQRLTRINKQRTEARSLIENYERVLTQQQKVDTLIKEDPSFKIKNFFATTLQTLQLTGSLTKETEVASKTIADGYVEVDLIAQLQNITMYQLLELLYRIEENQRIFVKDIKITKTTSSSLQIALAIATFETTEA